MSPIRGDVFRPDHYYHIYNRGVEKRQIFFNPGNYDYLLSLVKRYRSKYSITVITYCFMPNHYHLLLRQDADIPLSKFFNVLFNAYVQALNRQQGRSGPLFEGRFKHKWIDREEYLIHLCRYIHLNPVKAGFVSNPEDWPYSNYLEWIGERHGTLINHGFVKERFPNRKSCQQFVADEQDSVDRNDQRGDAEIWGCRRAKPACTPKFRCFSRFHFDLLRLLRKPTKPRKIHL